MKQMIKVTRRLVYGFSSNRETLFLDGPRELMNILLKKEKIISQRYSGLDYYTYYGSK